MKVLRFIKKNVVFCIAAIAALITCFLVPPDKEYINYFDETKEPPEFFEFLKNEKRIVFLICGHDHIIDVTSFGEKADNVKLFHDGHYSYAGGGRSPKDIMWGFCEAVLKEDGVDIKYVEPENSIVIDGEVHNHSYREQLHTFFKRRDI